MSPIPSNKRYIEPVQYVLGEDISVEAFEEAVEKIGDWFSVIRTTKEPKMAARQALERCLAGVTASGDKWFAAATASLNSRVRAMCRFDLNTMTPIMKADPKKKERSIRNRELTRKRKLGQKAPDPLLPDELREELKKKGVTYGEDPRTFYTEKEEARWRELKEAYLQEFPHLRSINAEAELDQLVDLHVLQDRMRMNRISRKMEINPLDAAKNVQEFQMLKKALGIHPDQLKDRVDSSTAVTIGQAAAKLQTDIDGVPWQQLRARYFLEEALQWYQMFNTPRADDSGYQLDEAGLFAISRCRTCHCGHCGTRNYVGWTVEEVEKTLTDRGLIKLTGLKPEQLDVEIVADFTEVRPEDSDAEPEAPAEDR